MRTDVLSGEKSSHCLLSPSGEVSSICTRIGARMDVSLHAAEYPTCHLLLELCRADDGNERVMANPGKCERL